MMAGSLTVPSPRTAKHSSALPRLPLPRTTGTPLSVAISLARILSPKRDRTSGDGPTHPTPESDRDRKLQYYFDKIRPKPMQSMISNT